MFNSIDIHLPRSVNRRWQVSIVQNIVSTTHDDESFDLYSRLGYARLTRPKEKRIYDTLLPNMVVDSGGNIFEPITPILFVLVLLNTCKNLDSTFCRIHLEVIVFQYWRFLWQLRKLRTTRQGDAKFWLWHSFPKFLERSV